MDWWTGMNPCTAMGGPAAAAVAAAAAVDAGALFDPWINYDDIDLGAILNQSPASNSTSTTTTASNINAQPACSSPQQTSAKQAAEPATATNQLLLGPFSGAHSDTNTSDTSSNNGTLRMVYSFPHQGDICSPSGNLEEAVATSVEQQQQQQQLICSSNGPTGQQEDSKHNLFNVITNHFSSGSQQSSQLHDHMHHQHHNHLQQQQQQHHHQHHSQPSHLQQSSKCSSTGPASTMSSISSMELSPQQQHHHRHQLSYMADSPSSPPGKQASILQPNAVGSLLMIDPTDNQLDSSQQEQQQQQHNYAQPEHLHHHVGHLQHPHLGRQMMLANQQQQLAKQTSVSTATSSNSSKQAIQKVRRCRHITDYVLAEEEKRLLIKEGYNDFPMNCQTRPLSKSEERILRKIRRKIRNKKSAQCSRQRKKEYVEDLERKYAAVVRENEELKQVIESIEQLQNNHNNHHHHYQHNHSHQATNSSTSSSSSTSLALEWKDLFCGGSGKMVRPRSPVKECSEIQ